MARRRKRLRNCLWKPLPRRRFLQTRGSALRTKKNLRLVEVKTAPVKPVVKQVSGGLLVQDADTGRVTESELKVVTWRPPTAEELRSLLFAWRVCKHVKSNAIVYARDGQTLGVGAGQMSRVDAARFGAMKAVLPLEGCVAASDAFFPFPDGLEAVAADRRDGGDPAGRLGEGPGRDRSGRQAGPGHGFHGDSAFQALRGTKRGWRS